MLTLAPVNVEFDVITVFVPSMVLLDVICTLSPVTLTLAPVNVALDVVTVLVPSMVLFDVI